MKAIQPIKVIETRREPPMWAVKIDSRYAAEFVGEGAKSCAIEFAANRSAEFKIVEKSAPKPARSLRTRTWRGSAPFDC
jgi:hypothetical protein